MIAKATPIFSFGRSTHRMPLIWIALFRNIEINNDFSIKFIRPEESTLQKAYVL